MSRILVLRWEKQQPGLSEELFRALELLAAPSRYAVNEYMNVDGKPVIVSALTGGRGSWSTTAELLIQGGLLFDRPIASIVIEFNAEASVSTPS